MCRSKAASMKPLEGQERVSAKARAMLRESGDRPSSRRFDIEALVDQWMQLPLPELDGKTPAQVLQRVRGWPSVELVLERMRSGMCA
jgi:hypothetical protein